MHGIPPDFPLQTFEKYTGLALPRHVSYPMPTAWSEKDGEDFKQCLKRTSAENPERGISLYLHLPFCESLCKFCACNKTILKKTVPGAKDRKDAYVRALLTEMESLAGCEGTNRPVRQIHWGGGSPSYLEPEDIRLIQNRIAELFNLHPEVEIAMEMDPRRVDEERIRTLSELGFNRVSLGIQDFDQEVQDHVHRVQSFELVSEVTSNARKHKLGNINYDLIYGLPYQTPETVRDMVRRVIELRPDRIAFYHYAQIPEKIATQRGMDYTRLPDSETKLEMFLDAIADFGEAGYEFIGLDHFALPHDELTRSRDDGSIQRNFQGMTTHDGLDLIGLGVSSITQLEGVGYWQNEKEIEAYQESVVGGNLPRTRGLHFSQDDLIRQQVLSDLYSFGRVIPSKTEGLFGIDWNSYFEYEMAALHELEEDGLVQFEPDGSVSATFPLGRILLRNIGAVFDAYIDKDAYKLGDRYFFSVSA